MATLNSSKLFTFPNTILKTGVTDQAALWDIVLEDTGSGNYSFQIISSTVNLVIPSNYLDTFTGNTSSALYINLEVTTTNGRITGVEIVTDSSPNGEAPQVLLNVPPSSFIIPIGVIGTNGVYYKLVSASPFLSVPAVAFEEDRIPPVPGLSLRVQWWTWNTTQ